MPTGQTPDPQFHATDDMAWGQATQLNRASAGLEDFKAVTPEDEFLFADPTDRPGEPLTQGAPFGPGMSATRYANEPPEEFLGRIAQQMATASGTPEVQKFARRVAERAARGL